MSSMDQYPAYFLGDACLCWPLGSGMDLQVSRKILCAYQRLKQDQNLAALGVVDVVPSYDTLAVHAGPLSDWDVIRRTVDGCLSGLPEEQAEDAAQGIRHVIPVRYHGEDLERVAVFSRLSADEVIRLHAAGNYWVAMIGFRPHFPYLLGLDPRLTTPRLDTPRLKVPAGAVAIGGRQTGIYPEESPGGWNIIGMTDPGLLKAIRPGDRVFFCVQES